MTMEINPDDLSTDQIATILEGGAVDVSTSAPEPVAVEQQADDVAVDDAPEPAPASTDDAPTESIEDLRADLQRVKEQRAHWEKVAGKNAGKAGFYEKQIERLRGGQSANPSTDALGEQGNDYVDPSDPLSDFDDPTRTYDDDVREKIDRLDTEARQRRRDEAIALEAARVQPLVAGISPEDMTAAAARHVDQWTQVLDEEDPGEAQRLARAVMQTVVGEARELTAMRQRSLLERNRSSNGVLDGAIDRGA